MKQWLEAMKKRKIRQISAVVLIICLLGSVVLSDHIAGVRAITDEENGLGEVSTPSNAEQIDSGKKEIKKRKKASDSDAEEGWASASNASTSNASPSDAREYEQLTLEDDSEPVSVSGKLPIGTYLRAEVITGEELSEYGLEELELQSGRAVFAYDIGLWLDGERYEPEYTMQVKIENPELLEGDLKLFQINRTGDNQEVGCSMDKEGNVSFSMKKSGSYAALDMGNPEQVVTIQDVTGIVFVTGVLPDKTTVTAEKLSNETIQQLELPEGEIACAYDIKLWVDGEEYQPEKPVKVRFLNQEKEEKHEKDGSTEVN